MYDLAFQRNNYMALKILFDNEIFTKDTSALKKKIFQYNLIENSFKTKDINFVRKILSYKDFNFKNLKYEEILINAINNSKTFNSTRKNDDTIAKLLIKSLLTPPHSNTTYKNTILNIAIKIGNLDLVQYLIESEPFKYTSKEINSKDLIGDYPILVALSNNNIEIFDYLLEKGADCNTKNNNGVPLLFLVIYLNDINYIISVVNEKTRYKINFNILDSNGYTPLMVSYNHKYMDIFNYLVEYLDINQKDKYGHTLLYYVIKEEDETNMKNLISIGAKINNDCMNIASSKRYILRYILEYDNIPINYINDKGESLLMAAILNSSIDSELFKKLIKVGCDVNAQDNEGNTPLIHAVKKENIEIVKLLIQYGVIKEMKNNNGKTAKDFTSNCHCINKTRYYDCDYDSCRHVKLRCIL
ncbi:hypothetical protein PIROE2DRAFT_61815 [Piromyces sp. E2]|nr:hypothetical protein PIROE2DRAFT_61815 [Piromyces sp. E2]|eukprot:OUM62550.1 hypothetical protein PIROE2DRAFT_61815 [Piromyces sp. E2]